MKILLLFLFISYKTSLSISSYSCKKQLTCEACIRDPYQCIWCALDNYNGTRCMSTEYGDSNDSWCVNNKINPKSSVHTTENKKFSSEFGQMIQIKPQSLEIKLRPGQKEEFEFSYKNAADYPVDLYFLMDGSRTMTYIKDETRDKSKSIYETMTKMTKNVRLGMGIFVDKNTLPYTTVINSSLSYSFKHRLNMTDDFKKFQAVVNNTEFGLNYDTQEGTLDALAQVMVCKELVGWRQESRKIVVVLTDSTLHAAGDGAYGGITRPFDGKCYSQGGFYTKELDMDYPSISIIDKLARDEEITVIFVVDNDNKNTYNVLSEFVSGSKCESLMTKGQKSISSILGKIYKTITSQLKLRVIMDKESRDYFEISFEPDCTSTISSNLERCKIRYGEEKKIKASIKLLKYYSDKHKYIEIANEGIKEKLTLKMETIDSCDCEREENSMSCSSRGTKRCGICECEKGSIGDMCQCQGNNVSLSMDTCRQAGSNKICNGVGDCICGSCTLCKERYSGKYCECNEDSCPRGENGFICSNLGKCECGTCRCNDGWHHHDCSCAVSKSSCLDGDVECNNRGECKCGSCGCDPIGPWDARHEQNERCHISPCSSCHILQCHLLEPCALCHLKKEKCNCDHINVTVLSNITEPWAKCQNIRVEVGCYTTMVYQYATDRYGIDVIIQSDLNCAESYYRLGGIILATLIIVGLLTLLIWKYITTQRDKREFEKFEKELQSGNYEVYQNPGFQEPIRITQNPIFGSQPY